MVVFDHSGQTQEVLAVTALGGRKPDAVTREPEVVVRRLVDLLLPRNDQQPPPAAAGHAAHLLDGALRVRDVLERHDVHAGVETAAVEGQTSEAGNGVQPAVVPSRVAHGEVHAAVTLLREMLGVPLVEGGSQDGLPVAENVGGEVKVRSPCRTSGAGPRFPTAYPPTRHLRLVARGRNI